jgi:hypothetical protein
MNIKSVTYCPMCHAEVKVVGKTTQHYEPVEYDRALDDVIKIIWNYYLKGIEEKINKLRKDHK